MIGGFWELRQRLPNVVMVEVLVTTICPYYRSTVLGPLCGANVLLVYAMVSVCVEVLAICSTPCTESKHLLFIYSETIAYTHPVACTYTMYIHIQNGFVNV